MINLLIGIGVFFALFLLAVSFSKSKSDEKIYKNGIETAATVIKRELYSGQGESLDATRVWVRFHDESGDTHNSIINSLDVDLVEGQSVRIKYLPGKWSRVVRVSSAEETMQGEDHGASEKED